MRVHDEGHLYEVKEYDAPEGVTTPPQEIRFMKRQGDMYPGNESHYSGTNCQEVIRVLINRLKYVNQQIPDLHNDTAIGLLRGALFELEERAAERHHLAFLFDYTSKDVDRIEDFPTCGTCGHIVCINPSHKNTNLKGALK